MNRDIIEVLPTFWSPTNTTLNLLNLGMLYKLSNAGWERESWGCDFMAEIKEKEAAREE